MYRKVRLLNVTVDDVSMQELVERFREGVLLTLHVDMIMKLQKDREFYELLPRFDLATCDSQILIWGARVMELRCASVSPVRTTFRAFTCTTRTILR